ncbi:hypothetical protein [Rhizobium leguminosarum]|uniref:hypothetical protein n=1 Tax=Rhizobium leguminosarum TaxID=384 RepID=UPI003F9E4320
MNNYVIPCALLCFAGMMLLMALPSGSDVYGWLGDQARALFDPTGSFGRMTGINPALVFGPMALMVSAVSLRTAFSNSSRGSVRQADLWAAHRFVAWCHLWLPEVRETLESTVRAVETNSHPHALRAALKTAEVATKMLIDNLGDGKTKWGDIRTAEARPLFMTSLYETYLLLTRGAANFCDQTTDDSLLTIDYLAAQKVAIAQILSQFLAFEKEVINFEFGAWRKNPS